MSQEDIDNEEMKNEDDQEGKDEGKSQEELEKIIEDRVNAQIADIKSKLDKAYEARDEAVKKAVSYEEEKRQAEITRLEEEGKHKEAYNMRVTELEAKLESSQKRIVELTRDNVVRDALKGLDFRNDSAADYAYRDVVSQLIQDENGQWVHRTGASVKDFIESFKKDSDKEFLFKPKVNSGAGQTDTNTTPAGGFDTDKPISEMTTEELMAAAAAGRFDEGKRWL